MTKIERFLGRASIHFEIKGQLILIIVSIENNVGRLQVQLHLIPFVEYALRKSVKSKILTQQNYVFKSFKTSF